MGLQLKSWSFLFSVFLVLITGCSKKDSDDKYNDDLQNNADILRDEDSDIAQAVSDPRFNQVTTQYGATVVPSDRTLPYRSAAAVADIIPWSSWWYPQRDNFLFQNRSTNDLSTLTKYDLVRRFRAERARQPTPPSAADEERQRYNPNSLSWEGLCDAWAISAISHREPLRPVTIQIGRNNVSFSVADLKALLLMTYAAVEDKGIDYYGERFTGGYDGWIYPDIFPEQFHRFVEAQLFDQRQPFVMDHDAGVEVWNVPVFKANYVMEPRTGEPNAVNVRMWLYTAESVKENEKSFVGTRSAVREYSYVLKGKRSPEGDLIINSGYWTKSPSGVDSRKDHPDYLLKIANPAGLQRKSWNSALDITTVDEILAQSY